MLEQMVESTNRAGGGSSLRREGFFLSSLTLVFSAVALALVYSLFSHNVALAGGGLDISQLVAPVEPPAEAPAPPPEKAPEVKPRTTETSIDQTPTRQVNMLRTDEPPPVIPNDVSTKPNSYLSRPPGRFVLGEKDADAPSSGTRTTSGGTGGGTGLSPKGITSAGENNDDTDTTPPPVIKKPEIKEPPVKNTVVKTGEVVNGKAVRLVTPPYPPTAKAVGASGTVNVQVLIDEEGNVVSAKAVTGHQFLRQSAEQAARASKFSPTILTGQKVKVTGVIVYNFVPR